MMRKTIVLIVISACGSAAAAEPQATQYGLRVPAGFEVTEFAGSDLANDIFCMTLDPKGRVVVSGRGFVRLLLDEKKDGRATKAIDFAGAPKDGAMGLFWEGDDLYCMGDGGLRRWRDANGEGRDKPPELLYRLKTGGEHEAHAIRRGPDGWLYVLCGNSTKISKADATLPTSPIKDPVAGCVLRFPPDFKGCEIVADGFRNAYGFDYNSDGELFTYDSDNERCVSLPWYEGTRLYHVVEGGHYGWQNPQYDVTWRQPPYFADVVAPLADLGRGSPTGVVCYRHVQFPAKYRGGLFLADWTFGRMWFVKLRPKDTTYSATPELFLEAAGDNGFAPTAAAVDPLTGDLYLSIGGRGTRGAVYRVRHAEGFKTMKVEDAAKLQPASRSLEWVPGSQEALLRRYTGNDLRDRRNALELLRRFSANFEKEQLEKAVRWNVGHIDRGLHTAAAELLATFDDKDKQRIIQSLRTRDAVTAALLAVNDPDVLFAHAARAAADAGAFPALRLQNVRLLQRALGDITSAKAKNTVWEGYTRRSETAAVPDAVRAALRKAFPSKDADLNRELSRTLAMIEDDDPATLTKIAERLTADSNPIDDIHYLIVLARLKGKRSEEITKRVADVLVSLDRKITTRKLNRDNNWPERVSEMLAELVRKDAALNAAILAHPDFGRPDHALLAKAPGFDRRRAAEVFVGNASKRDDFTWNAPLVEIVGELPPEKARPVLRNLWGKHGLDEFILPHLAKQPDEMDRGRFLKGMGSAQLTTVELALNALEKLATRDKPDETLALILALKRLPTGKEEDKLAAKLTAYLEKATGETKHGTDRDAWSAWFAKKHPDLAKKLGGADGVDVEAWNKRFAALDWNAGDAERGRALFTKTSCAACHSGTQALGPDLRGVGGRFSRADLFTAIIQPSKDVATRYRTTRIVTEEGKTYQGIIIYEAVDSLILQTGPATTLRLANKQIAERRLTATSLMPVGLIDKLTDGEIADLYAYLRARGVICPASLSPPHGRFGNVQALHRRADRVVESGRVAGVAGRRLQVRDVLPPEAVELAHQRLAQILARHRRQGHAEVFRVGTRLKRQLHGAAQPDHAINAPAHPLRPHHHHAVGQRVLDQRRVAVAAAVLVDEERHRVVARRLLQGRAQETGHALGQHRALAVLGVEDRVEAPRTDDLAADQTALDRDRSARFGEGRGHVRQLVGGKLGRERRVALKPAFVRQLAAVGAEPFDQVAQQRRRRRLVPERRQDATLQAVQPAVGGVDRLGIVDQDAAVVLVGVLPDGGLERLPEVARREVIRHAEGDEAHHERAEVGAVARLVQTHDPRHRTPLPGKSLLARGRGDIVPRRGPTRKEPPCSPTTSFSRSPRRRSRRRSSTKTISASRSTTSTRRRRSTSSSSRAR
jgi:putative heme-binding domain-containing protein